jgi:hypothetical protein
VVSRPIPSVWGGATDRHQHHVNFNGLLAEGNDDRTVPDPGSRHRHARLDRDAAPGQLFGQFPGGIGVGSRHYLIHHLEEVYLTSEIHQQAGELTTYGAGPNNGHSLRSFLPIQSMVRADDPDSIERVSRNGPRSRSGSHDDVAALDDLLTIVSGDDHSARPVQTPETR